MFERYQSEQQQVILVHLKLSDEYQCADVDEFRLLARSSGASISGEITGSRDRPDPRLFIGKGKVDEIIALKAATESDLIIFNHNLTATQAKNLEQEIQCQVVDRTGLILDIFAQRAQTHEGKLQVELAQLQYMSTRLVRGWTHLERQKGGIGLRGPGETQLETDRRLISARIAMLKKRLEKVRHQRALGRQKRRKHAIPTVSMVGYTNAGKSSLFNLLTHADVYVKDQLFATLDPTLRQLDMPQCGSVILVDTVGFIRHLPHDLIAAFRATLEETSEADLLLHVVDAHAKERDEMIAQVNAVLHEVNADQQPTLMVYNKIDLLEQVEAHVDYNEAHVPKTVWVSAQESWGIEQLMTAIGEMLVKIFVKAQLTIAPQYSKLCAALYNHHAVVKAKYDDAGNMLADVVIAQTVLQSICRDCGVADYHSLIITDKP